MFPANRLPRCNKMYSVPPSPPPQSHYAYAVIRAAKKTLGRMILYHSCCGCPKTSNKILLITCSQAILHLYREALQSHKIVYLNIFLHGKQYMSLF